MRLSIQLGKDCVSSTWINIFSYPDDVIKWKHFSRYWPFVRVIHRSSMDSPHKCQWREALVISLICTWTSSWANNCGAGDLRRHRAQYDVTVMISRNGEKSNLPTAKKIDLMNILGVSLCVWNTCFRSHGDPVNQSHKSHNAPVSYPTMHHSESKCAHFCSEWCIVGYGTGELWDLWIGLTVKQIWQAHWGLNLYKMGVFCRRHSQRRFFLKRILYSDSGCSEICS